VRIVQGYQTLVQGWLGARQRHDIVRIPYALRLQARIKPWRDLAARVFGLCVWPVRVASVNIR